MNQDREHNQHGGFGMPPGYFSGAARRLRNRLDCAEELRSCPALEALKGINPFTVSAGYFEANADVVSYTGRWNQDTGFSEPPGYFLLQEVRLREQLAGTTSPDKSGSGFSVPEGYFENRGGEFRRHIVSPGRVIRLSFRKAVYVAAAAMLLVVAGIWLYRSVSEPVVEDCLSIACLEKKDVLRSGALDNLSEEDLMLIIDGDDLEEKLMLDDLDAETGPADSSGKGAIHS